MMESQDEKRICSIQTTHNSPLELNRRWGRVPISKPPKTENLGRELALSSEHNALFRILCGEFRGRYSLHKPRFEGKLAKNKKNGIGGSMPELSK